MTRLVSLSVLVWVVALGCSDKIGDTAASEGDSDSDTSASEATGPETETTAGEVYEPPPGCAAFQFPEFEGPYGQVFCEVYVGCFGGMGGREPGTMVPTTIEECIEMTCGNGDVNLENEIECSYNAEMGAECLAAMSAIADDLSQCPDINDTWYPSACGLAISCSIP